MKNMKYELKDNVFAFVDNTIKMGTVVKRICADSINQDGEYQSTSNYVVEFTKNTQHPASQKNFYKNFYEDQIFPTRDQLINSLK
jgi:hypothetical protein